MLQARPFRKIALLAGMLLALGACAPNSANRWNIPTKSQLEKLQVGTHNMEYVRGLLGTPSTVGSFDKRIWYYIGRRTERWAFLQESVLEQQVIAIYFDETGKIEHIQKYDKDDSRKIETVERKTPTAGEELGVLDQIIGNLGRFNRGPGSGPSRY